MAEVNEGLFERLRKLLEGLELKPEHVITDMMLIAKSSNMGNGKVGLCYNHDVNDWIVRRGMLECAMEVETMNDPEDVEEQD